MVHLYLCLPDRCRHQIHKSKGDRQCKIGQKENVCLFCSYVVSARTGQADRGINAPSVQRGPTVFESGTLKSALSSSNVLVSFSNEWGIRSRHRHHVARGTHDVMCPNWWKKSRCVRVRS